MLPFKGIYWHNIYSYISIISVNPFHNFFATEPDKVSVGTRISPELANKCKQDYGSVANAINACLELLYKKDVNKSVNDNITYVNTISELNTQIEEKEQTIKDLQINNGNLIKEIENLKNLEPNNKEIQQLQFESLKLDF